MLLDLADELVRFFLRHLAAANHVLHEVARAFDYEAAEPGGCVHDIFHCGGHLASGFQTYLMGLCRHLGDSILDVSPAMTGAPLRGNRCRSVGGDRRGRWLGRFVVLSHHSLLIYVRSALNFGRDRHPIAQKEDLAGKVV
jgi:hypothetical protein